MNQKVTAFWFAMVIIAIFSFHVYNTRTQTLIQDFNYSKFSQAVKDKEVQAVTIHQDTNEISGEMKPEFEKKYNGKRFQRHHAELRKRRRQRHADESALQFFAVLAGNRFLVLYHAPDPSRWW
jgi:ATP-dependent Zn protease